MDEFYKWFVGFVDAEGSFKTNFRKNTKNEYNRIIFCLSIYLHYKDEQVLLYIKKMFNIDNNVYILNRSDGTKRAELTISNSIVLANKIIPIFIKHKCLTKKYHDFNIWLDMFNLYMDKSILWKNKYEQLWDLKCKLNNYEYKHDDTLLNITPNISWYVGFMEGEGSFSLKFNKDLFKFALISELSQREESIKLFNYLLIYLKNLKSDEYCSDNIKDYIHNKVKFNLKTYPKDKKIKITLSSIDYFYWVYFPNVLTTQWNSRKNISMTLFLISTIILKHGLHYTKEGLDLYNKIILFINFYEPPFLLDDIIKDIDNVLSHKPIYNVNYTQDHNGRKIGRKIKSKFISSL